MDIERLAVSHIDTLLGHCPRLTSYINSNDKTPFTDGHIEVYSGEAKTNDQAVGRVEVQVKGRKVKAERKARAAYSLQVSDLRAYLNFSGVLYLVVNIDPNTRDADAFYALLNPFRIGSILGGIKPGQKSVAVPLKPFPTEPKEIEALVQYALTTKLQNPKQGIDPVLYPNIQDFTIYGTEKIDLSKPTRFSVSDGDYAIFATTDGGMELPLSGDAILVPQEYVGERFEGEIGSGDVVFENPMRRRLDDETVEFELSENLRFSLVPPGSSRSGKFDLNLADRLDHRLKDVGFFLALMDTKEISFGGNVAVMNVDAPTDLDNLRSHFSYLTRLSELFQEVAAPESLVSISAITEERSIQLGALYKALVQRTSINTPAEGHGRIYQPVGDYGIELMTVEQSEGSVVVDTFAPDSQFQLATQSESEDGQNLWQVVTPYELLDARETARTLNLHLGSIVAAYEAIVQNENVDTLANHAVLRLIEAADIDPARTAEFLEAAEALNDWLIERCGDEAHHVINQMQIRLRTRTLTAEERATLRDLRRESVRKNNDRSLQVELSCSILLDEEDEVASAVSRLSASELETFMSWPIWRIANPDRDAPKEISTQEAEARLWITEAIKGGWPW